MKKIINLLFSVLFIATAVEASNEKEIFSKNQAPRGWPSEYITMSSISEGIQNTFNYSKTSSRFAEIPVDTLSIFTYASGGDDTWTLVNDHERLLHEQLRKIEKQVEMARKLESTTSKKIMPVLVVYTSGGSSSTTAMNIDFGFSSDPDRPYLKYNLDYRIWDLIKVAQKLQSYKDADHLNPATIVLNPDFLGEVHKIYTGAAWAPAETVDAIRLLEPKVGIALLNAVKYAYDKVDQPLPTDLPSFVTNQGNISDYMQTINWIIKTFAPDIPFGWVDAVWAGDAAGHKWIHHPAALEDHVAAEASFLNHLRVYANNNPYKPDFLAFDKYERDDFDGTANSLNNGYVYNIPAWNTYTSYVEQVSKRIGNIPIMIFQLQGGHLQTLNDIDNRSTHGATGATYFFGDSALELGLSNIAKYILPLKFNNPIIDYNFPSPSVIDYLNHFDATIDPQGWQSSHVEKFKNANVFAILWGGGNTTSIAGLRDYLDDNGWLTDSLIKCYSEGKCYSDEGVILK